MTERNRDNWNQEVITHSLSIDGTLIEVVRAYSNAAPKVRINGVMLKDKRGYDRKWSPFEKGDAAARRAGIKEVTARAKAIADQMEDFNYVGSRHH